MRVAVMLLLGMAFVLWLPLLGVILASRWRASLSPGRRRLGRVIAFFSLWAMFNISTCATWGAFRLAREVDIGLAYIFLGAQLVAPWLCAQVIATAPALGKHSVQVTGTPDSHEQRVAP